MRRPAALVIMLCVAATARPPVQRDVEGYANAVCLKRMGAPYLREQADLWLGSIVQRGPGEIDDWRPLAAAVAAEITVRPVAQVHGDTPMGSTPAPVLHCAEIIDAPRVRAAIDATIRRMAPAYRRR